MKHDNADRRANPRFPAVFDLQGRSEERDTVARMQAADLSLGGLRCVSNSDFPEMTRLAVRLQLPLAGDRSTEALDVNAVVVRSKEVGSATQGDPRYELALFFTGLEDNAKQRIADYLNR